MFSRALYSAVLLETLHFILLRGKNVVKETSFTKPKETCQGYNIILNVYDSENSKNVLSFRKFIAHSRDLFSRAVIVRYASSV